jgi:predicted nucleotidyltransferase
MKICALIAEYNPFHLGHLKHVSYIKDTLGAEKVIVIMSGNFTQRGEIAVIDKFTRARHAIYAGADLVIELPTVCATANAENFALGAVGIINSLGIVDGLCFGVESGDRDSYIALARAMNNESKDFKRILKEKLDQGISLAKAKFETVKALGSADYDESLINSPNNVLGLEYTKALLKLKSDVIIFPMKREGDHNDKTLKKGVTSATSIREVLKTGKIKSLKKSVPPFVYKDLKEYPRVFETLTMAKAVTSSAEELARTPDCTEGLENRIKAFLKDNHTLDALVDKVSTKRYTKTRVQRILLSNLLGITADLQRECSENKLYAKVLAVNSDSKDLIPLICKNSSIPVLTRKSDSTGLKKTAEKCFNVDVLASDLYGLITENKQNEHQMIIV